MIFAETRLKRRIEEFNKKYSGNPYTLYRVSDFKTGDLHIISFMDDTAHTTITSVHIESDWRKKWKRKRITLYYEYSTLVNDIMYVIAPLVPPEYVELMFIRNLRNK